jgi:PhnB protein
MKTVYPYLNFPGNAEEAFTFYRDVFGGDFLQVVRFRDFPDNAMGAPESELDRIAHIALPLGDATVLYGTDVLEGWRPLVAGTNFYIAIEADSPAEADRLFARLSAGGSVGMPLEPTEWAELYSDCTDRFGIQWMIMYTGDRNFTVGMKDGS